MPDPTGLNLHEDIALFREAVNFTASRTGFNPRLIEMDYFCTVLLAYLSDHGDDQLVFKGGTCLAKVHAGFYRLSEDLDFTIPLAVDASRTQRRQAVAATKNAVAQLADHLHAFAVTQPLTGANNSTQYNGAVEYESPTTGQPESILIEVSVREPLLISATSGQARTVLFDPIGGEAMVPDIAINCIALNEAMAEKFRAALSRRYVAIRDFYDLDYAVSHLDLDPADPHLIEMVRQKISVPGNAPVDVGPERLAALKRQVNTRLRTVLRDKEFQAFDLDQAFRLVVAMAERLS
ncbi:MAG: nucleotidyl transferase AbiEii/AbiGii toxin family protein [Planctomycetes bacterium]|nr:nucleotidyl transferase AbiEii/AbiGii toxin family protein [Planctomycetota bacterium]